MSLVQAVKDGALVESSASKLSDSTTTTSSSSSLDKQAFLQLLVAQMKYQDPLEPTSNTEYIAQLATFSQLEALQNLDDTLNANEASDLIGKAVMLKTTSSSTGDTYYTAGYVDAMTLSNGDPYLLVSGNYYALTDLYTVLDDDYYKDYLSTITTDTTDTSTSTT
ncbi:flagellar hook assembly protein FlgD [Lachnotalea glycerini]|uniref:Flagellar hook capping protein n=1 Tax=Lachnotalea glycerini TaxID=1763509 RepID=A0A371JIB6_9FIRM|nr:flagellar hook capping FlgD N-terminal domain-containing protein [Lachnotalea glycerini]RDY32470.1 hypothetical protein CG710_003305 [Lachnotalea glycerini]